MNILHLCNDFCHTKVHSLLYRELDALGVQQTVFNPVRNAAFVGLNHFDASHTSIFYANVVKPWHKYAYHIKRRHVFRQLLKSINPNDFTLIHATTLITDGGLAYLLFKRYRIPYIVTVRNTDVNEFLKYMPHTWPSARKILLSAEKIIFINNGLRHDLLRHPAIRPIAKTLESRIILMPNGINNYYLDHISHSPRTGHNIIYVGQFTTRKNVLRLAKAVLLLRKQPQFSDLTLTLVGGGAPTHSPIQALKHSTIQALINKHPDAFLFVPPVSDPSIMCQLFSKAALLAMPSLHETFGLVYIEALSQNLPILFSSGQGVDGLLPSSAGIPINPYSVDDIARGLASLLSNPSMGNHDVDFGLFRWNSIAKQYLHIYYTLTPLHQ